MVAEHVFFQRPLRAEFYMRRPKKKHTFLAGALLDDLPGTLKPAPRGVAIVTHGIANGPSTIALAALDDNFELIADEMHPHISSSGRTKNLKDINDISIS